MKVRGLFLLVGIMLGISAFSLSSRSVSAQTRISYSVDSSTPWTKAGSPYIVMNHVVVNVPLTIEAGVVVKFAYGNLADLTIQNDFIVKGTREEPVVFTSIHDGVTPGPLIGDWVGLNFNPSDDKILDIEHAKVMYSSSGISIYSSNNHFKNRTVKNCELKNNGYGVIVHNADPVIENNLITGNQYGIRVYASSKVTKISNNSIYGNETGVDGVNETNPSLGALDATYNWWGDKDGPTNPDNPNGSGDKITGKVIFNPWTKEDPIEIPDPVIIIPGIMGSWKKDGSWQIDPIFHTYDNLYEEFTHNGYTPEQNLFTFPYEWRDSNAVNAVALRGKIDDIRRITRRPKVDIVAHSMGGLLAREYIEFHYNNDVDQLVTVGTPQLGAPKDYLTWEAGEFDGPWASLFKLLLKNEAEENGYYGYLNIFDYIQGRPVVSTEELLPTYNYLYDVTNNGNILRDSYSTNYPGNEFLENLNNVEKVKLLKNIEFTKIVGKLENNDSTTSGFNVINTDDNKLWRHGIPEWFGKPILDNLGIRTSDGDKTVPLYSSESLEIPADYTIPLQSEHNALPTDAQIDILKILTGHAPTTEVGTWHVPNLLLILVHSPVDIQAEDSQGRKVGKHMNTNELFEPIPGSFYSADEKTPCKDDPGKFCNFRGEFITIPNPEKWDYKISAKGTGNGHYEIETLKISENPLDPANAKEVSSIIEGEAQIDKIDFIKAEISDESIVLSPSDITSPVITNGAPSGELADAVTETQISLTTDKKAICKFSTAPNTAFESMENNLDTADGLSHTAIVLGLKQWNTYGYFAKCQDESGNSSQGDYDISFSIPDKTPPAITGAVTTQPNANGWYNSNVTIHFEAEDNESGIANLTPDITISADGENQSVTGIATDNAGNTAEFTVSGINIDKTAPTIELISPSNASLFLNEPVEASYTCSDDLSGVDLCIGTVDNGKILETSAVGNKDFSLNAKDKAGNSSQIPTFYKVKYRFDGFLQPINDTAHQTGLVMSIFKGGSTVPIKFQLKDFDGNIVQATRLPLWFNPLMRGKTTSAIDETAYANPATIGNEFRWDSLARQYIYNWSTKGSAIGYFYRISASLEDGTNPYVDIGLR